MSELPLTSASAGSSGHVASNGGSSSSSSSTLSIPSLASSSSSSSTFETSSRTVQQICDEYMALVERSQQLFSGLRDLPQFGRQWLPYFQKAFEVYTRLWKLQQTHRNILESNHKCALKRWEIGEIASKIGQLYYHFYLRTSEVNYLKEAFVFYEAIRTRGYFRDVLEQRQQHLMIKKLRYYARFIVVCLLLNRKTLVRELGEELSRFVDEYVRAFRPSDAQEWQFVIQEITMFLQADSAVSISGKELFVSCRTKPLVAANASSSKSSGPRPRLEEAILVGNYQQQIKFSELTLDMFRIVQVLERDPASLDGETPEERRKRRNPNKHLLYRPTFSNLMIYLSNAFKDLPDDGILLLYLSADGVRSLTTQVGETNKFTTGGISLNSRKGTDYAPTTPGIASTSCLYPDELSIFTRKPFFLIVDSDNSFAFKTLKSPFGQPLVCLMSPQALPPNTKDPWMHNGNLFTHFLYDSFFAFCSLVNVTQITSEVYEKCQKVLSESFEAIHTVLQHCDKVDESFLYFLKDDYLQQIICRYVFCSATLLLHEKFQAKSEFLPACNPELPTKVIYNHTVLSAVNRLANLLGVEEQFRNILESPMVP